MSKTEVDDKVGDEVVTTNWINPVVLGQALFSVFRGSLVVSLRETHK